MQFYIFIILIPILLALELWLVIKKIILNNNLHPIPKLPLAVRRI
jgi:hypothetical protein